MPVEVRKQGRVSVLAVTGKVTVGSDDVDLRDRVHDLLDDGERELVIDLTEVSFLDSAGLGEIVSCAKRVVEQGGTLRLAMSPGGRPAKLFSVTSLDRVFDIYPDVKGATESFEQS
jgi:anti-anti-sigma factor